MCGMRILPLWVKTHLRCNYHTIMIVGMVTAAIADLLIAIAVWILVVYTMN